MNKDETNEHYGKLTHQQQRFCDLYLTHFNAFKAAVECGYSENTSRKGALLHVPKIQRYLKDRMAARSQRLEITHDMILRELAKVAFSNMGNYYDEYACLKRMNELTVDEKAAISYYDITEVQDGEGYRVGMQSRIKLHNKMSALDKIARHLNFYGTVSSAKFEKSGSSSGEWQGKESGSAEEGGDESQWYAGSRTEDPAGTEEGLEHGADDTPLTPLEKGNMVATVKECVVVDRSEANLPMDYPEEDFELEGIDLKTLVALEEVNVSPGRDLMIEGLNDGMSEWQQEKLEADDLPSSGSPVAEVQSNVLGRDCRAIARNDAVEKVEKFLTISPLDGSQKLKFKSQKDLRGDDESRQNALGIGADTGPSRGSGLAVAKACAV